jgi:hypothetical protein
VQTLLGSSSIDLGRSQLATAALEQGFEETFWIDSDIVFNPGDVDKIRELNRPFVAGLYPKKNRKGFAVKYRADTREVIFGVGGGLLEVELCGMGFTHIRREVYEAMRLPICGGGYDGKPIVPYFLPMIDANGDYCSEDFSFCNRARAAGFSPFADTTIRLGHVDRQILTWEDLAGRTRFDSLKVEIKLPTPDEQIDAAEKMADEAERLAKQAA